MTTVQEQAATPDQRAARPRLRCLTIAGVAAAAMLALGVTSASRWGIGQSPLDAIAFLQDDAGSRAPKPTTASEPLPTAATKIGPSATPSSTVISAVPSAVVQGDPRNATTGAPPTVFLDAAVGLDTMFTDDLARRFHSWNMSVGANESTSMANPEGRDGFDAWPIVLPLGDEFSTGRPVAGGRVVARVPGLGTLYEAPLNPVCTAGATLLGMSPATVASTSEVDGRVTRIGAWPWAWIPTAKFTANTLCSQTGRSIHQMKSNRWIPFDRTTKQARSHWVLENVTFWQEKFYIADAVFDDVVDRCDTRGRGGGRDGSSWDTAEVCDLVSVETTGRPASVALTLRFGGHRSYEAGLWPPLIYEWITLHPLSRAQTESAKHRKELDAAVWVPPSDFGFSYHLVNDVLMPTHHALRRRVSQGLPTAFFAVRPFATRYGYAKESCHHGAKACIDFESPPNEWRRFMLHMAGGRKNIYGLDDVDAVGKRSMTAKELIVGQPTHCETLSRSGSVLLASLADRMSPGSLDCSRSFWEWRKLVRRFLVADGRLLPGAVSKPIVPRDETPRIIYLSRRKTDSRQLRGSDAMLEALRATFEGNSTEYPGAVVEEVIVTSLAETYVAFTRATVLVIIHGAAMVNVPLLRANAGVVAIDTTAPPMMPYVPSWVHVEFARATCVEPKRKSKECGQPYVFTDFKVADDQIARVVGAVRSIVQRQRSSEYGTVRVVGSNPAGLGDEGS